MQFFQVDFISFGFLSMSEEIRPSCRYGFHILPCSSISPVLKSKVDIQIEQGIYKEKKQEKQ